MLNRQTLESNAEFLPLALEALETLHWEGWYLPRW